MMVLVSKVAPAFDAWHHIQRLESEVAGLSGFLGHDHGRVASTDGRTLGVSFFKQISIFRKIRQSYGTIKTTDVIFAVHRSQIMSFSPRAAALGRHPASEGQDIAII